MKTLLSTTMLNPVVSGSAVGQVVRNILRTGRITTADQQWLLKANTVSNRLNDEEMKMIQQVCDRLSTGLVKVVD